MTELTPAATADARELGIGSDPNNPLVLKVQDWLVSQGLRTSSVATTLNQCCERMLAAGIPLWRAHMAYSTLHPLFASQSITWTRAQGVDAQSHPHGVYFDGWHKSPLKHMIDNELPYLRRRLRGAGAMLDFPMLEELRDAGGTDYLGYAVEFGGDTHTLAEKDGIAGSWCTDQESGFSAQDLNALLRLQQTLALTVKVQIREQITRNILSTYLGSDAGHQVLSGNIQRGDGERIRAIIWYSDMRASTALADSLTGAQFLDALNSYFECSAGAVIANDGEVLRFVGDAVLGIFPVRDGEPREPARSAINAALEANSRLVALNAEREAQGKPAVDFGLALHLGEVMFGNIGVPERLEFSVTGPAANEVARMEDLTKALGVRIVVSAECAKAAGNGLYSLGCHVLRGVHEPKEVFGIEALKPSSLG